MGARKNPLHDLDTYVFVDASNIRLACLKTLGQWLDFAGLSDYFYNKYHNLKELRYYEGIAQDDVKKAKMFEFLAGRGYIICPLERKSYNVVETETREVRCPECNNKWIAKFQKKRKILKSNVDVFLATELLTIAHSATKPTHIILVSCDGDYAEMIKNALNNPNIIISVLATPPARSFAKNTLSTRLKQIYIDYPPVTGRYQLQSIGDLACFSAKTGKKEASPHKM